jgi:hypothetical protein
LSDDPQCGQAIFSIPGSIAYRRPFSHSLQSFAPRGRLTDPAGSPILSIAAGTPPERHADVAQWQSNGFVNRRLPVQVRPSAPACIDLLGRYQSGQMGLAVNQLGNLRGFESLPAHHRL